MTVSREETEIRNQPHEMWAEGTSDRLPVLAHIEALMQKEGYKTTNVSIWYDGMQGFYRWNCDITYTEQQPPAATDTAKR